MPLGSKHLEVHISGSRCASGTWPRRLPLRREFAVSRSEGQVRGLLAGPITNKPSSRHARLLCTRWADPSKETCDACVQSSSDVKGPELQQLLHSAADQQQQAEATSGSLRHMVQQLVHAQQLIRGTTSPLKPGGNGIISNAAVAALQAELQATQRRLLRALSALQKLQTEHARQQQLISVLEQQVHHLQAQQTAAAKASTTGTLSPDLAAVQNETTSMQMQAQQQDLAGRLTAKEQAEQQLQRELKAKHQQHMEIEGKVDELSDALAQAKKDSSQMQWQLLSKEAALGSLKQQIADTKETACQAGAAQQAQLQHKDATINTLLEKLSMLEAESAAEMAWLQDSVKDGQQQTAELQVQVQLQQDLLRQPQLQQQRAVHGATQTGELSSEITAVLRHALLVCLLEQLSDIRTAYQMDLQVLQQRLTEVRAVEVAGNNSQAVVKLQQHDAEVIAVSLGDNVPGCVQQLQQIVANNIKLAERLASMVALMSCQSQQLAAVSAPKDELLMQRANQPREVEVQQPEQHLAPLTREMAALKSQLMSQQQELCSNVLQQLEQQLAPLVVAVSDCGVALAQVQQYAREFGTEGAADLQHIAQQLSAVAADVTAVVAGVQEHGVQQHYAQVTDNSAVMQQLTETLQQQLSAPACTQPAVYGQVMRSTEEVIDPANCEQQQTVSVEAAIVTQQHLQQQVSDLRQYLAVAAAERDAAVAAQQQLREQLVEAEEMSIHQQGQLQQHTQTPTMPSSHSPPDQDAKYIQQVVEIAELQQQQQQQTAELHQMTVEMELLRISERKLQQQLQQLHAQHQQAASTAASAVPGQTAELEAKYKQQVVENAVLQGKQQQQAAELRHMAVELQLFRSSESSMQLQLQQQAQAHRQEQHLLQQKIQGLHHLQQQLQEHELLMGASEGNSNDANNSSGCDLDEISMCSNQSSAQGLNNDRDVTFNIYDLTINTHEHLVADDKSAAVGSGSTGSLQSADAANGAQLGEPDISSTATVTATISSASNGAGLLGSGLSLAMLLPLVDELHRAQKSEAAVQAAKHKLCAVLNLLGATELAITQQRQQALTLQQHMWKVAAWKPLLIQVWQLHETEEGLAADLVLLQQLEDQHAGQQLIKQLEQAAGSVPHDDQHGQQQQQLNGWEQEHQHTSSHNVMLAELVGWEGDSAVASSLTKIKVKVGQLLLRLADRQLELARGHRHVRRLAGVLMSGTGGAGLVQMLQPLEVQQQQLEKSRTGVRQQLVDFQELQA